MPQIYDRLHLVYYFFLWHPSNSPPVKILTNGLPSPVMRQAFIARRHLWLSSKTVFFACFFRPLLRIALTSETLRWSLRCKMFIKDQHLWKEGDVVLRGKRQTVKQLSKILACSAGGLEWVLPIRVSHVRPKWLSFSTLAHSVTECDCL